MEPGAGASPKSSRMRRVAVAAVAVVLVLAALAATFYLSQPRGATEPGVPGRPMGLQAVAGDGRITISWEPVDGALAYNLYMASEPGVSSENYATLADGARFADVTSPYEISSLENDRTYYFRVTAANEAGESPVSAEVSGTPVAVELAPTTFVAGVVTFDSGSPVAGANVVVRTEDSVTAAQGTTDGTGRFNIGMRPMFPTRILAEVTYSPMGAPSAVGFRWSPLLSSGGAVDVGRILLPNPANKHLTMFGPTAKSLDGGIVVESFPANVASIWARSYDPDATPDIFPGDLAEGTTLPLNSVVFLWISALDANGDPVVELSSPATVRMRVPQAQWVDLEDLEPGNGPIDTPIYSFDYDTGYWVREANGVLTDGIGTVIDESGEAAILSGTYAGDVFAEFSAGHFSWWNVDKPPSDCGADFGDADDPPYPTLLANDGARHMDICRAWLGAWVDAEAADADVPDLDAYDDGLLSADPIKVRVSNWNWPADLYLNALVDGNGDGDWADPGEWVIQNLKFAIPTRKSGTVETDVTWDAASWLRLTLTGSPITDYVGTGEFAIGETEDYPFLKFRLSVYATGNGTVTSDPVGIDCHWGSGSCSAEYMSGSVVNLTATPDPGESFIEWGGDCAGSNATCSVLMSEDRSVYASFTSPYYRLTVYVYGSDPSGGNNRSAGGNVTSEPPGIYCGGGQDGTNFENCTAVFLKDSVVVLTAIPDPGWTFYGWGGDCTGTSPTCTLTMDREKWVTAIFTKT